jgi:SAM-dependent methyltransferase
VESVDGIWDGLSDEDCLVLAETIGRVARDLSSSLPAPHGAPLFGLDMTVGDARLLDRFSQHGIFRKYQRAVALGCGLGGTGRCWAVRLGCSVASVDPHTGLIAAARRLATQTALGERVCFESAALDSLPFRDRFFTHAWSVERLDDLADPRPALREALRVLRPSGSFAVYLPGRSRDDADVWRWSEHLSAAGFEALHVQPVPAPEIPPIMLHAERHLLAALRSAVSEPARGRITRAVQATSKSTAPPAHSVLLFAERPS